MAIHYFDATDSTMDRARELIAAGRFPVWDSAFARTQTAGRGQTRKKWSSPPGNIYATIRLPAAAPFASTLGAIAATALFLPVLDQYCDSLFLKWPNDIVCLINGRVRKLAGLLIEERDGAITAGIGVNFAAPEFAADATALPPAGLTGLERRELPDPLSLWREMAARAKKSGSDGGLVDFINSRLVWAGEPVELTDNDENVAGVFRGIDATGAALIESGGKIRACWSGSMRGRAQPLSARNH